MPPPPDRPVRRSRLPWWIVGIVAAGILLLAVPISVPMVNDAAARRVEQTLLALPVPEGAQVVDSSAQAGKLVGNGNGMQYVGALLVRSEGGIGSLSGHYTAAAAEAGLDVTVVASSRIESQGMHGADGFLRSPSEEPDLYVVYAFGDGPGGFFEGLDLRGH